MNFSIRRIQRTQEDFAKTCELLKRFASEHSMGELSAADFDVPRAAAWIAKNIDHAAWVAEVDGIPAGTVGVHEVSPWYSDSIYLTDGWLYVLPEYRKSNIGAALIDEAKQFAIGAGLPLVLNIFSMEDTELKIKLFQRKKFKLIGGSFIFGE